jgi:hypothetical protein
MVILYPFNIYLNITYSTDGIEVFEIIFPKNAPKPFKKHEWKFKIKSNG